MFNPKELSSFDQPFFICNTKIQSFPIIKGLNFLVKLFTVKLGVLTRAYNVEINFFPKDHSKKGHSK